MFVCCWERQTIMTRTTCLDCLEFWSGLQKFGNPTCFLNYWMSRCHFTIQLKALWKATEEEVRKESADSRWLINKWVPYKVLKNLASWTEKSHEIQWGPDLGSDNNLFFFLPWAVATVLHAGDGEFDKSEQSFKLSRYEVSLRHSVTSQDALQQC